LLSGVRTGLRNLGTHLRALTTKLKPKPKTSPKTSPAAFDVYLVYFELDGHHKRSSVQRREGNGLHEEL
jgi:hypothetical protein